MEHDFSVCSTGKFPEKVELLKRKSRFPVGNFPMELRVPFTGFAKVYQFQAAHDHIIVSSSPRQKSLARLDQITGTCLDKLFWKQ